VYTRVLLNFSHFYSYTKTELYSRSNGDNLSIIARWWQPSL